MRRRAQSGSVAIEYALIGSLLAVGIVGAVVTLGPQIEKMLERVAAGFGS